MPLRGLPEIERLKKAARMEPIRKCVELNDGTPFEFYHTPLTCAQKETAQKAVNSDDIYQLGIQIFVNKAQRKDGTRIFSQGHIAELKNEVRDSDLQRLVAAVFDDEGEEKTDMKSPEGSTEEG